MILSSQNMIIDWWTRLYGVSCPCFTQIFLIICIKTSQTLQILLVTTEYFVILDTGPRHWLLSDMRWYWMESAKSKVNNNLESQYWYRRGGGEDRRLLSAKVEIWWNQLFISNSRTIVTGLVLGQHFMVERRLIVRERNQWRVPLQLNNFTVPLC